MALVFYNSLSRRRDGLSKTPGEAIAMYSCGPTVYDFAHLGNLRSFIFADTLFRTLGYFGYKPSWAMNITDVDDKTIRGTINQKGLTAKPADLADYTKVFLTGFIEDLEKLNIDPKQIKITRVTEIIPLIQEKIIRLIDTGFAYRAEDGSTYFSVNKYQEKYGDYGQMVGENFLAGKKVGARVKQDDYTKENISDFALWKARSEDDGEIYWDHPILGQGRPGWHIECSVVNDLSFKQKTIDFHTGGVDLAFPHHTNEMAQSRALNDAPLSHFWLHLGHLLVEGQKMSKSLGNFVRLKDLPQNNASPLAYRYLVLQSGYGQTLNFTQESLRAAGEAYRDLLLKTVWLLTQTNNTKGKILSAAKEEFMNALADNLNTGSALAVLWKVLSYTDTNPADQLATILDFDQVLGLDLKSAANLLDVPGEVRSLATQREKARAEKDWSTADQLREQINEQGFEISDTENGPFIFRQF